jgi:hypothetical protein
MRRMTLSSCIGSCRGGSTAPASTPACRSMFRTLDAVLRCLLVVIAATNLDDRDRMPRAPAADAVVFGYIVFGL